MKSVMTLPGLLINSPSRDRKLRSVWVTLCHPSSSTCPTVNRPVVAFCPHSGQKWLSTCVPQFLQTMLIRRSLSIFFFFCQVQFYFQVIDDKLLSFLGVFAHIIFQDLLDMRFRHDHDGLDAHVGADEAGELVGRNFTQALEPGDLGLI